MGLKFKYTHKKYLVYIRRFLTNIINFFLKSEKLIHLRNTFNLKYRKDIVWSVSSLLTLIGVLMTFQNCSTRPKSQAQSEIYSNANKKLVEEDAVYILPDQKSILCSVEYEYSAQLTQEYQNKTIAHSSVQRKISYQKKFNENTGFGDCLAYSKNKPSRIISTSGLVYINKNIYYKGDRIDQSLIAESPKKCEYILYNKKEKNIDAGYFLSEPLCLENVLKQINDKDNIDKLLVVIFNNKKVDISQTSIQHFDLLQVKNHCSLQVEDLGWAHYSGDESFTLEDCLNSSLDSLQSIKAIMYNGQFKSSSVPNLKQCEVLFSTNGISHQHTMHVYFVESCKQFAANF